MISVLDLSVGARVVLRNGQPAVLDHFSERGPWALMKYETPQRYKGGVIRWACVETVASTRTGERP